jgi:pimeloyl-ACP methyl ester carboxylesterase
VRVVPIAISLWVLIATAHAAPPRWETLPLPPPMMRATTTGFVTVRDAKLYYATYGTATGEPVVLLHGGLGNSDHWAFQVPALARSRRVIVIDSRNQGRSTLGKSKLSYRAMADDVLAVLDELGVARAALVGWSDGGEIALDLAITHPDRVARLFVFGANYDRAGSKPRRVTPVFSRYAAKCRRDYEAMSRTPRAYDDVVASLLPVWRSPVHFTKDQLRSIKAPTVVSDGDHDEILELDQIKEMAQLIPNAKLVIFERTSHFALWQDPETFTQAVVDFLGGT